MHKTNLRRIAHIINPVIVPDSSDLKIAQPITFESMRVAKKYAEEIVEVDLMTTQFSEDRSLIPPDFSATPDLTRSVLDLGDFSRPRKLPLLRDILDRFYENAEAEYLIYTNVDIALMPNFYVAVNKYIDNGYDAFVINRRTVSSEYSKVEDLPLMYAEVGEPHPGHDCFVFKKELYPDFVLGNVCVGIVGVGWALIVNMAYHANNFKEFTDKHLTFHRGNDRTWRNEIFRDYSLHNRACMTEVMHELEQKYGKLESNGRPIVRVKLTGFLSKCRRMMHKIKQVVMRLLG